MTAIEYIKNHYTSDAIDTSALDAETLAGIIEAIAENGDLDAGGHEFGWPELFASATYSEFGAFNVALLFSTDGEALVVLTFAAICSDGERDVPLSSAACSEIERFAESFEDED